MSEFYAVGGSVRDQLMGITPHDYDFSVVSDSFEDMAYDVDRMAMRVFQTKEKYGTIRALVDSKFVEQYFDLPDSRKDWLPADFVWARKDGVYSDGRRPDTTEPGSLYEDLSRRDFTINAIALAKDRTIIDPFAGQSDIQSRYIRAVGDPIDRFLEDALRVVRAYRFAITKEFILEGGVQQAMGNLRVLDALRDNISVERVREELDKAFRHDPQYAMDLLSHYRGLRAVIFDDMKLGLLPTLKDLS